MTFLAFLFKAALLSGYPSLGKLPGLASSSASGPHLHIRLKFPATESAPGNCRERNTVDEQTDGHLASRGTSSRLFSYTFSYITNPYLFTYVALSTSPTCID